MQILYFFVMFTISVASDGNVCVYNSVYSYKNHETMVQEPRLLFSFDYHKGDNLKMKIYLKDKPKNWNTDVYVKHAPGVNSRENKLKICTGRNDCEENFHLKEKEIIIELVVSSTNCTNTTQQNIIHGKLLSTRVNNTPYNDLCLTTDPCVIEVDLKNTSFCGNGAVDVSTNGRFEPTNTTPKETMTHKASGSDDKSSGQQTWMVLSSVLGMCVIILTSYICVKKYYRRNSRPVETLELNTYATVNEVVYADLSLAHADSQPPRREESPYAQIIGVIRPVDGNVKKK